MYNKLIKYMSIFVIAMFLGGVGSLSCMAQEAGETLEVGEAPSMADVPSPYVKDFNIHMKGNISYNSCVLDCFKNATECRCRECSKVCNGQTRDFGSGPVSTYVPLSPEETATCMNSKCSADRRCFDDCARNNPVINPNDPSPFSDYDKFALYGDPYFNTEVRHCWRWGGQGCRWDRCRDKSGTDLISCMEQNCKPGYDQCFKERERIRNLQ